MDKDQLYSELKKIMAELFEIDPAEITLTANLYEDLDIDSIDAVDLAIKVRDLTGKQVNPDEFKQVRTVEDLVNTAFEMFNN